MHPQSYYSRAESSDDGVHLSKTDARAISESVSMALWPIVQRKRVF